MKNLLLLIAWSTALIMGSFLCTSFSAVPVSDNSPPQVAQKRQQQLERRTHRLKQRLQRSNSKHQRQRLKRRLRRIQQKQSKALPGTFLGILGLSASVLATILMFFFIYTWATVGNVVAFGGGLAAAFAGATILGLLSLLLAILAIVLCSIHLARSKEEPEKYGKKGLSTAGIVIASITLGLMVFIYLGYLIFLAAAF